MKYVSENQLISKIRNGDTQAFDTLAEKYRHKIKRAISHYVHEQSAINDVTQETLLRAFEGLPKFNGHCQFYTWLYKIAINTAKNYAAKNNKRLMEVDIDSKTAEYLIANKNTSPYAIDNDPENIAANDEFETAIKLAIEALPSQLKKTLILKEDEDLGYKEIAEKMHCPEGTVRSRIFRARDLVVTNALIHLLHHQHDSITHALAKMQEIRTRDNKIAQKQRKPRQKKQH